MPRSARLRLRYSSGAPCPYDLYRRDFIPSGCLAGADGERDFLRRTSTEERRGHRATDAITNQQIQEILRRLYGAPIESKQDVADEHASGVGRAALGHADDQERLLLCVSGTVPL